MSAASPIVYVVDDDEAVRSSLAWMLEAAGLTVRSFATPQAFLQTVDEEANASPVGCALIDLRLPGISGLELQAALRDRAIELPIIMITGHGDVPAAVRAMKAGAIDFIEKPFDDQYLLDQIHSALRACESQRRPGPNASELRRRLDRLSPRERQVMDLVVDGWLNKQIASELGLSHKTVEVHRAHVMHKMEAVSFAELVRMAVALEQDRQTATRPTL